MRFRCVLIRARLTLNEGHTLTPMSLMPARVQTVSIQGQALMPLPLDLGYTITSARPAFYQVMNICGSHLGLKVASSWRAAMCSSWHELFHRCPQATTTLYHKVLPPSMCSLMLCQLQYMGRHSI